MCIRDRGSLPVKRSCRVYRWLLYLTLHSIRQYLHTPSCMLCHMSCTRNMGSGNTVSTEPLTCTFPEGLPLCSENPQRMSRLSPATSGTVQALRLLKAENPLRPPWVLLLLKELQWAPDVVPLTRQSYPSLWRKKA